MKDLARFLSIIAFLSCVFSASIYAQKVSEDKALERRLLGVWQDNSAVGSGMADNFQVFASGKYVFNFNQMDATKRVISHSGKWKVSNGKLILKMKRVELWIGGKWVKASGSTATEYEIEGGKIIKKKISPKEILELSLDKFVEEELHQTTRIDGVKYWKLSDDPTAYEN